MVVLTSDLAKTDLKITRYLGSEDGMVTLLQGSFNDTFVKLGKTVRFYFYSFVAAIWSFL